MKAGIHRSSATRDADDVVPTGCDRSDSDTTSSDVSEACKAWDEGVTV